MLNTFSSCSWETQCLCIKMGMTAHSTLKWIEFPSHSAVAEIHLISVWYKAIFFFLPTRLIVWVCMWALALSASFPCSGGVFVCAQTPFLTEGMLRNVTVDFTGTIQIYTFKITFKNNTNRLLGKAHVYHYPNQKKKLKRRQHSLSSLILFY